MTIKILFATLCLFVSHLNWTAASLHAQAVEGVDKTSDKIEVLQLSFDDVVFDIEKDEAFEREMLTEEIEEMEGRRISIRGFILPNGTKDTGNTKFILVRDNMECCFGPGAALYDCMLVKLEKGHEVDFTVRPVTVEGTLQLKELVIGERTMAIFRLKNCKVSH